MATLPQLNQDDLQRFDAALAEFLSQTSATAVLLIDKGGFLITRQGDCGDLDLATIGALAAGAFMASQSIAGLVKEKNFNSTFQQGEKSSMVVMEVDEHCLLIVIFTDQSGLGIVKYYSANAASNIARQMLVARQRNPAGGFDLSELNIANPGELFRQREA